MIPWVHLLLLIRQDKKNLYLNFSTFLLPLSVVSCPLFLHKQRNIMATNEHLFCWTLFPLMRWELFVVEQVFRQYRALTIRSESRKQKRYDDLLACNGKKNIFSVQTAVNKHLWFYLFTRGFICCNIYLFIYSIVQRSIIKVGIKVGFIVMLSCPSSVPSLPWMAEIPVIQCIDILLLWIFWGSWMYTL